MVTSWFLTKLSSKIYIQYMMSEHGQDFDGMRNLKKNIYLFLIIPLNYKCSKDAKTGLGLVRGCLVQILSHYLEKQFGGQSSCSEIYRVIFYVDFTKKKIT